MKPQTMKDPTGPFSRKKLLAFLEKKAKDEKDWENVKAYVKKQTGTGFLKIVSQLSLSFLARALKIMLFPDNSKNYFLLIKIFKVSLLFSVETCFYFKSKLFVCYCENMLCLL